MSDDQLDDLQAKYADVPFERFITQWQYDAVSSAGVVHSSLHMLLKMLDDEETLSRDEIRMLLDIALQSNDNTIRKIRFAARHVSENGPSARPPKDKA